jgi:hypothetical protein
MNDLTLWRPIVAAAIRHILTALGALELVDGSDTVAGAILIVIGFAWSVIHKLRQRAHPPSTHPPVHLLVLLFVAGFASGCARFVTVQTDASYENGKIVRQITTRASAHTLFEGKSALAQFQATQTDKTQSAKVGSLNQESTNQAVIDLLIRALQRN